MYSPETPKTPTGKASKGTVQVINSHGRLQLRFRHGGQRHYISVGLPDTPTGRIVAQQKAHQIQLDILSGNFDNTLAKYKSDPVQTLKSEPKTPHLTQIWESFCAVKQPVVAPGTWRNGYCVNTGHLERCPHKQLKEAQKIFDWAVTHLNPDPAKRFIQALSSRCRWAVRNELIDRNPFEGLSKDIKIPKDEHDIIFDQAVVDSVRGRVLKGLKTQQKRKFPINEQLQEVLSVHRASQIQPNDFVFPSPKGRFLDIHNFRNRGGMKVLTEIGLRYRKPYQARHTFITHCLEEGISVQQVAKWVGNSPEVIMKHYAGTIAKFQVPLI